MLLLRGVFAFALLAFWVYCVVEVATTGRREVRTLPKTVWVLLVLLLPVLGGVLWWIAGRPHTVAAPEGGEALGPPRAAPRPVSNPDDDEAFLRRLRERAEEQRRRAGEQPPEE
jgi:hypothetical protein